MLRRPRPGDCEAYYFTYIDQVPEDGDVLALLATEIVETGRLLEAVPTDRETFRYQPDRWSVREVVGHVLDAERVFAFRALSFARGCPDPLPSMEQDEWARLSRAHHRPLADLYRELYALRESHVEMFRGIPEEAFERRGSASGFQFTALAIPYILVGHEIHHRRVIAERYLTD